MSPDEMWQARVLCALAALGDIGEPATSTRLKEMVGAKFASQFSAGLRLYRGSRPVWESHVDNAVDALKARKLVSRPKSATGETPITMTKQGRTAAVGACERGLETVEFEFESLTSPRPSVGGSDMVLGSVVTPALRDEPSERVMIELNLRYGIGAGPDRPAGITAAIERVKDLWRMVGGAGEPTTVADQYLAGDLTDAQVLNIVTADSAGGGWPHRAIYRIWPDFEVDRQIDASCTTIKALPAQRSFAAYGDGIVWAVIDSGIDQSHPHFAAYETLTCSSVADLHHDFVSDDPDPARALMDDDGHGTHVAAIIAGGYLKPWLADNENRRVVVAEKRRNNGADGDADPIIQPREVDADLLAGVAPRAKLVSLRVLSTLGDFETRTSRVMNALAYVRHKNEESGKKPRIHGVNLSLGYKFFAKWFACGQSPLCLEVNRLVLSGVVVVIAAGNSGYVTLKPEFSDGVTQFSAGSTINDPGNAERAITVGSTHRDAPHTNGISYFSSRGPTGDGRLKPDLVAPGERITSAAAGNNLAAVAAAQDDDLEHAAVYIEDSGTSMAAPHVSGAAAALLSVQQELIGQPDEVKRILMASATSLNRDRNFQGAGMVDLMRALQTQ